MKSACVEFLRVSSARLWTQVLAWRVVFTFPHLILNVLLLLLLSLFTSSEVKQQTTNQRSHLSKEHQYRINISISIDIDIDIGSICSSEWASNLGYKCMCLYIPTSVQLLFIFHQWNELYSCRRPFFAHFSSSQSLWLALSLSFLVFFKSCTIFRFVCIGMTRERKKNSFK